MLIGGIVSFSTINISAAPSRTGTQAEKNEGGQGAGVVRKLPHASWSGSLLRKDISSFLRLSSFCDMIAPAST